MSLKLKDIPLLLKLNDKEKAMHNRIALFCLCKKMKKLQEICKNLLTNNTMCDIMESRKGNKPTRKETRK